MFFTILVFYFYGRMEIQLKLQERIGNENYYQYIESSYTRKYDNARCY